MKYLCWTLPFLLLLATAQSQGLALSGKIAGFFSDSVELNFPADAGYQQGNSYYEKVNEDGSFGFDIHTSHTRFALLRHKGEQQWVLLSPGRRLKVLFRAGELNSTIRFAGEGKIENEVIRHCMTDTDFLSLPPGREYINCPEEALYTYLLPALREIKHVLLDSIGKVQLPDTLQQAIVSELSYRYATTLYDFQDVLRRSGKNKDWLRWADSALSEVGLPGSVALEVSPSANVYLHDWAVHQFIKGTINVGRDSSIRTKIEKIFNMPFDSVRQLGATFGDDYLVCVYSRQGLPLDLQERLLVNRLTYYSNDALLPYARQLLNDLILHFPHSHFIPYCTGKINVFDQALIKGKNNEEIVFRQDSVYSLATLLAPYKGKVVYLEIWGTWCGPCREEVKFLPALKERFRGKGVVFLYLDMDEDRQQDRWQEFVRLHAMTGQHLRLSQDRLEYLWKELLHTADTPRLYPSCFIFDGNGRLAEANAPRPSDGEKLYRQLDLQIR